MDVFPLLGPAAVRNGELTERLAGIEVEEPGVGCDVEALEAEAGAGAGLNASTGTEVTGMCVRSGRWLKTQFGRVQRGFSGQGRA